MCITADTPNGEPTESESVFPPIPHHLFLKDLPGIVVPRLRSLVEGENLCH